MKKVIFAICTTLSLCFMTSCATMNFFGTCMADSDDASTRSCGRALVSIDRASEKITPENEYYIGRSISAAVLSQYKVYLDAPKTTNYLNKICSALTITSDVPYLYNNYSVTILDTNEITAMSSPGGHIFISKGLINCTKSEDALAAVIAHEIAHIQMKHGINAIKKDRKNQAWGDTFTAIAVARTETNTIIPPEWIEGLSTAAMTGLNKLCTEGYSKNQEYEADKMALDLMVNAGYDPSAMTEMLELVQQDIIAKKKARKTDRSGWKKTHPAPKSRINRVNKALEKIEFTGTERTVRQTRFEENKI